MTRENKIMLVAGNEAPSRLLEKHSDARMHLAGLINEKLRIESKLRHLAERVQMLQDAQSAEHDAASEISALNAAEAAAMTAWVEDPSVPMPSPDIATRDSLMSKQRAAQARAAAARQASASIRAEQQRETTRLEGVGLQIGLATVPVIIEELEPLIAEFVEANAALAARAGRIAAGSELVTKIANAAPLEAARPAFAMLEVLNEQIRGAFGRPAPDLTPHKAHWDALSAALYRDPIARLQT